jgi:hypothetical protein
LPATCWHCLDLDKEKEELKYSRAGSSLAGSEDLAPADPKGVVKGLRLDAGIVVAVDGEGDWVGIPAACGPLGWFGVGGPSDGRAGGRSAHLLTVVVI